MTFLFQCACVLDAVDFHGADLCKQQLICGAPHFLACHICTLQITLEPFATQAPCIAVMLNTLLASTARTALRVTTYCTVSNFRRGSQESVSLLQPTGNRT